ncbi:MAG: T9SS type A sorting domain-containing protein, partial [Pseudomonadota bacterium]
ISVNATNSCGTSKTGVTIYSNCFFFTASPNPATDNVNIAVIQSKDITSANKKIYQIKVTDQAGNPKKQYKFSGGVSNTNISLKGLFKGTYIIEAFDGTYWKSLKIIKQ